MKKGDSRRPAPADGAASIGRGTPRCPHCGRRNAEVISLFGTQAMTLQYRCGDCGEIFEAVKYDH